MPYYHSKFLALFFGLAYFNKKINNPKIVNNSYLIFKKLLENKKGNYVECGVFMGGTLMSAVEFTKQNNIASKEISSTP